MTWFVLLVAAVLSGVAAAFVLRPLRRARGVELERLADPLEDERRGLLRALRDLEEEHAEGALADDDYRALRTETEARAVTVLRALTARDGTGELAVGLKELRAVSPNGSGPSGQWEGSSTGLRSRGRWLPWALIAGAGVAVVAALLIASVANRTGDLPITGGASSALTGLGFFEERVAQHPADLAARLDLAKAYMDGGDVRDAVNQYLEALRIDPRSAEARANLGFVLYLSGRPKDGLAAVDQALSIAPNDPEALYFRGVILLRGMRQTEQAADAFRRYLDAAPFGSHRADVQRLLQGIANGSPSP